MAQYHPTADMLEAHAAGTLSDGLSLFVAAHLTYCPACRREVERQEVVGGAFLATAEGPDPASPVAAPSLDSVLARLDAPAPAPAARPRVAMASTVLPRPILDIAGAPETALAWRFRMPGLHEVVLDGFGEEQVSLLRARPGAGMLAHTHKGVEATLILSGAMADGDRVLRRGDASLCDDQHDHRPRIVGDELCYCLVVLSGGLRFTGRFGRMLNIFTG